jgi:hypothetical protein
VHHGALFGSIGENVLHDIAEGSFGQATLDGVVQFQQGGHGFAQDLAAAEDFSS